jgi:hypothetical protein
MQVQGVILQHEYVRSYPMGVLAGPGDRFTSIDGDGFGRIERRYDKEIDRQAGANADADGMFIGVRIGWSEQSQGCQDGLTVALTLDMVIQEIVRKTIGAGRQDVSSGWSRGDCDGGPPYRGCVGSG